LSAFQPVSFYSAHATLLEEAQSPPKRGEGQAIFG
jgi:hypothetical protein